jgi:hypothetical protein
LEAANILLQKLLSFPDWEYRFCINKYLTETPAVPLENAFRFPYTSSAKQYSGF